MGGHLYKWCACFQSNIPDEHKLLRIHLNSAQCMELFPSGPRECFYFRSLWSNVRKLCQSHHGLDINNKSSFGGCAWGLTVMDVSDGKPTYAAVKEEDICLYPLLNEALPVHLG